MQTLFINKKVQLPAIISIFVGALVLIGWWQEVDIITQIISSFIPMHPLTAVSFILCGFVLYYIKTKNKAIRGIIKALAIVVFILGFLYVLSILGLLPSFVRALFFEEISFRSHTLKMPPTTAVNICLTGVALLLSFYEEKRWKVFYSQYVAVIVVVLSLFSLTGYIYAPFSFSYFSPFYPMSLHAAVTFLMVCFAILNLQPKHGFMKELNSRQLGGKTARYFIPIAIFVPIILGVIVLEGERRGFFQTGFGVAITTLGSTIIFLVLILRYAKYLNKESRSNEEMFKLVKEQKDFIQKVTDTSPNIIFIYDLTNKKNLYLNANGRSTLGMTFDHLIQVGDKLLESLVHPYDLPNLEEYFESFKTANDTDIKLIEYRLKDASGTYFWCLTQCSIFKRNKVGKPTEVIGVTTDINGKKDTELKLVETNKELAAALEELKVTQDQLVALNNELEEKVSDRTSMLEKREDQLLSKNQELQRLNYMLDNFMHMAAHDLRGPLANLKMIPAVLSKVADEQRRLYVLNSIDVLVSQLDQVLMGMLKVIDFQTISDKSGAVEVNFQEVLLSVKEQLTEQLGNPEGEIKYNFELAPSIYFIEPYIRSIFFNLLSNAYKYADPVKELYVKIISEHKDGFIVLTFEDNGPGIDLKRYGKDLFKPYSRLNQEKNGKGLGLYLLKNIIERNQGRIEIESKISEGVKFTMYLKEYEMLKEADLE